MAAKFVAEEGLLRDLVLSLEEGDQWVIGRDPDACQLLVEDPSVSRKHVLCRRTPEGIVIENLSATNPILVNDEEISQPRLLNNDDTVKIGNSLFRFYSEPGAHLLEEEGHTTSAEESVAEKAIKEMLPETPVKEEAAAEEEEEKHDTIFEDAEAEKAALAKVHFDLMETGRWLLKVVNGPNNGAEFSMQAGNSYLLGTDPNSCDIVFHDNSVSRQHARITISPEDVITIEDLKSRNGTRVDGEAIDTPRTLTPQTLVTMGTSSFVIYDREGEMQTIISPLLPSIVKVLQHEEVKKEAPAETKEEEEKKKEIVATPVAAAPTPVKTGHALGTFIVIGILMGLFAIIGIGVSTLFHQESVVVGPTVDPDTVLADGLKAFPEVKYSFNKMTGRLLLVGHVLTATDKSQMLYNLQGLTFIKDVDDSGVIIDEYVWNEANQVLSKNPSWKGVTVHSPTPGRFVLSGYLSSREQAAQVWDYITRNFPYLDLLENRIIVEEDIINAVTNALHTRGFFAVTADMSNGELTLTGHIPVGKMSEFQDLAARFQELPGVRRVQNYVTEAAKEEAVVNISEKYSVTGSSRIDNGDLTVIINGRILAKGDVLDGMKITDIQARAVYLEKDSIRYRIDY